MYVIRRLYVSPLHTAMGNYKLNRIKVVFTIGNIGKNDYTASKSVVKYDVLQQIQKGRLLSARTFLIWLLSFAILFVDFFF